MDPSGRSAAAEISTSDQSSKQNPSVSAVSNTTVIQTPPLSTMMQQAVAMQQFQFQQALLMQQVMAAQQVAARAATVKSAAEMAAARAAEISKQLKGSDAEEEKSAERSKSRSRSKSASRSLSTSRQTSGSRSPVRHRRGRSISRSPIRYRRNYYSPSRTRDYYSYRSRGYRGYYRGGRSDYSWNLYRRERDRDYFYRGSRRSRSRGRRRSRTMSRSPRRDRSRGRRRSRTPSRSPRRSRRSLTRSPLHHREKNVSPKHKREEIKSKRSSKRSVSRELKRISSASSGSVSFSPERRQESGSPSNVDNSPAKEAENSKVRRASSSPSGTDENDSPVMKERSDSVTGKRMGKASPAKAKLSSSPARSLSVSIDYSHGGKEASEFVIENKSLVSKSPSDEDEESDRKVELSDHVHGKQYNIDWEAGVDSSSTKGSGDHRKERLNNSGSEIDSSVDEGRKKKLARFPKSSPEEESEDDRARRDCCNNLTASGMGKGNAPYGSREPRIEVEKERENDLGNSVLKASLSQMQEYASSEEEMQHTWSNNMRVQGWGAVEKVGSVSHNDRDMSLSEDQIKGFGRWNDVDGITDNVNGEVKGEDVNSDVDERQDEDAVFEGPSPATVDNGARVVLVYSRKGDSEAYGRETEAALKKVKKRHTDQVWSLDSMDKNVDEEDAETRWKDRAEQMDQLMVRCRSRLKDSKKHEKDVGKHDKRKHRHRKHKKKDKYKNIEQEKDEERDERKEDGEAHKGRRHKKRHKKDGEHRHKDKKKRKHKHKRKYPSDSLEDSLIADADGVKCDEDHISIRKRSRKRQKKSKKDLSKSVSLSSTSSD